MKSRDEIFKHLFGLLRKSPKSKSILFELRATLLQSNKDELNLINTYLKKQQKNHDPQGKIFDQKAFSALTNLQSFIEHTEKNLKTTVDNHLRALNKECELKGGFSFISNDSIDPVSIEDISLKTSNNITLYSDYLVNVVKKEALASYQIFQALNKESDENDHDIMSAAKKIRAAKESAQTTITGVKLSKATTAKPEDINPMETLKSSLYSSGRNIVKSFLSMMVYKVSFGLFKPKAVKGYDLASQVDKIKKYETSKIRKK